MQPLYHCKECGGLDLSMRVWQKINTGEIGEDADRYAYCHDCEDQVSIDTLDDAKVIHKITGQEYTLTNRSGSEHATVEKDGKSFQVHLDNLKTEV